jgi:hypothetical protein
MALDMKHEVYDNFQWKETMLGATMPNPNKLSTSSQDDLINSCTKGVVVRVDPLDPTSFITNLLTNFGCHCIDWLSTTIWPILSKFSTFGI